MSFFARGRTPLPPPLPPPLPWAPSAPPAPQVLAPQLPLKPAHFRTVPPAPSQLDPLFAVLALPQSLPPSIPLIPCSRQTRTRICPVPDTRHVSSTSALDPNHACSIACLASLELALALGLARVASHSAAASTLAPQFPLARHSKAGHHRNGSCPCHNGQRPPSLPPARSPRSTAGRPQLRATARPRRRPAQCPAETLAPATSATAMRSAAIAPVPSEPRPAPYGSPNCQQEHGQCERVQRRILHARP